MGPTASWPTICILSFFTQEEIIESLRRVNKEALVLCKRAFAARRVSLHKINLKSVKFFERAEEIKITEGSLPFFAQFKDNFFEEILTHYKNVKRLTVNLNFLFEPEKKDRLLEKLASFTLKEHINTFNCEDAMLNQKNLESFVKSTMLESLTYLKLPRNNLGNHGITFIFSQDRLRHVRKLDLSSNNFTQEGAEVIARSTSFPRLSSLDLRINKIRDQGL